MVGEVWESIVEKIKEITDDYTQLQTSMDEFSEWDTLQKVAVNVENLSHFAGAVVGQVEAAARELLVAGLEIQSEDKQQAAAEVIDSLIVLPSFLEPFDGAIIKMVISSVVNGVNLVLSGTWDDGDEYIDPDLG